MSVVGERAGLKISRDSFASCHKSTPPAVSHDFDRGGHRCATLLALHHGNATLNRRKGPLGRFGVVPNFSHRGADAVEFGHLCAFYAFVCVLCLTIDMN